MTLRVLLVLLLVLGSAVSLGAETSCEDDRAATRALVAIVAQGREAAEIRLAQALQRVRALEVEVERLRTKER